MKTEMNYPELPTMPTWPDPLEADRADHTGLRRRMLTGTWYADIYDELERHISGARQVAWGDPDMSSNIFRETTKALTALYQRPPTVENPEAMEGSTKGFLGNDGILARAGLWAIMKRVQFFTIGLRECFLRVDISGGKISYRIVTPDVVTAQASPHDPQVPIMIKEMRLRYNELTKKKEWTLDHLDISDPENPIYEVLLIQNQNGIETYMDATDQFLGGSMSGANYPYRDMDGVPFLPYSIYHAELTGQLFDPFYNAELVKGSLSATIFYTYFAHIMRDCAHPQRYIFNARLSGISSTDGKTPNTAHIDSDPASIMVFEPVAEVGEGQTPGQFGQFQPGGDVEKTLTAVTTYERRLATLAGINPADVQKMSGDPRSGYAIAISRSSLREAQAEYTPSFRLGDLATIEITAKLCNRYIDTKYPESGYEINYYELPLSPEEQKAMREDINNKIDRGLMSAIQAVMVMYPNYDRDDAERYLRQVQLDNLKLQM